MAYWAVLQIETQREHIARMFLMREFETYAPRIKRQGRILPLFPSYIFIRIESAWYRARWSPHVTRILMNGEMPARLPDEIIAALRGREIGGVVVLPRGPRFHHGDRVRIVRRGSPLEGLFGIYAGMRGVDRELVLMRLLGQEVRISLPSRDIASA